MYHDLFILASFYHICCYVYMSPVQVTWNLLLNINFSAVRTQTLVLVLFRVNYYCRANQEWQWRNICLD